jgi:hypothetical protein
MSVPKSGGFGSMFFGEHCAHLVVDISHRHQKRGLGSGARIWWQGGTAGAAVALEMVFTPRSRRAVGVYVIRRKNSISSVVGGVPSPRMMLFNGG